MPLSLKFKIVLSMIVAIMLTAFTLMVVSYQTFENDSWRAIKSESENTLNARVQGIGDWIYDKQLAIEALTHEIERDPKMDVVPFLRQTMTSGGFGLSYFGNEQGEMFRQDPRLNKAGYDPRTRGWYKLAKQTRQLVTTEPYVSATMKTLVVTITSPIIKNGQFIGAVGSNLALDKLTKDILSMHVPGDGYAMLLNNKGNIVAHFNKDNVLQSISDVIPELSLHKLITAAANKQTMDLTIGGVEKVVEAANIENTDWILMMVMDRDTLQAPINSMLYKQILIGIVILLVVAAIASFTITRLLSGLGRVTLALTDIAEGDGDLTQRIDINSNDEVGVLANKFNEFVGSLHSMINKVRDVTVSLNEKANMAKQSSQERSQRLRSQQDEITMVATAVTEMASATAEIANNAENTAKTSNQSVELGNQGYQQMQKSLTSIHQLADELNQAVGIISDLESHSNEISTILSTIRDIAEQTNLLALNAAIEAARAGEQGRGFAVVADEVRVLSQRTHQSTEEIQTKIEGLQKVTANAVNAMTQSHTLVESSVADFNETGESLQEISQAISLISDMATQIASAAEEQSLVTSDINTNTESVRELSNEMSAEADKGADEAEELHNLVRNLEKEIARFKL